MPFKMFSHVYLALQFITNLPNRTNQSGLYNMEISLDDEEGADSRRAATMVKPVQPHYT